MFKDMMSEQVDKLFEALSQAQGEIEGAKESGKNPHFKSKYAELHDIIQAGKDILKKYGLAVTQTPNTFDGQQWLMTMLGHKSGQYIKSCIAMPIVKNDPQGFGSALTYCRRYAWASILGISTFDDDAEQAMESHRKKDMVDKVQARVDEVNKNTGEMQLKLLTKVQVDELAGLLDGQEEIQRVVFEYYSKEYKRKVAHVSEIFEKDYEGAKRAIQARIKKQIEDVYGPKDNKGVSVFA